MRDVNAPGLNVCNAVNVMQQLAIHKFVSSLFRSTNDERPTRVPRWRLAERWDQRTEESNLKKPPPEALSSCFPCAVGIGLCYVVAFPCSFFRKGKW